MPEKLAKATSFRHRGCSRSQEDPAVTFKQSPYDKAQMSRALEVSIHIGLATLLAASCLFILLPFVPLLAWGIIIAVAAYPTFRKLERLMGGRGVLPAVLFTLILLSILILPVYLLA